MDYGGNVFFSIDLGIGLGVFVLGFGIYQRVSCNVSVVARCSGYRSKYEGQKVTCYPIFKYNYNSEEYMSVGYFRAEGFEKNQDYKIWINPRKPNIIWHKRQLELYIMVMLLCLICIMFALSGVCDRMELYM